MASFLSAAHLFCTAPLCILSTIVTLPLLPSSSCAICGTMGLTVFIDTEVTTLRQFIDAVLKGFVSINSPNIDNNDSFNFIEERCVGSGALSSGDEQPRVGPIALLFVATGPLRP